MDSDVPNGFGPEATGTGCTILLSVGRVLLPIGMILSSADMSTVLAGVDGLVLACGGCPAHDWLCATPVPCVEDPQRTPDVEPGNADGPPPPDGRRIEVLRRDEDRSRTEDFETTDSLIVDAADGASSNGG